MDTRQYVTIIGAMAAAKHFMDLSTKPSQHKDYVMGKMDDALYELLSMRDDQVVKEHEAALNMLDGQLQAASDEAMGFGESGEHPDTFQARNAIYAEGASDAVRETEAPEPEVPDQPTRFRMGPDAKLYPDAPVKETEWEPTVHKIQINIRRR